MSSEQLSFWQRWLRPSRPAPAAPRAEAPRLVTSPPTAAGRPTLASAPGGPPSGITCIDYSPEEQQVREVDDLAEFLVHHRPSWTRVRWINVDGLEPAVIRQLAEKYQLHALAIEDVLHTVQRPKAEDYPGCGDMPGRLFIVARSAELHGEQLRLDQIRFFLGRKTLLTFQETRGDAFDPIRHRLQTRGAALRAHDASFLLYALLDAIVDSYFPILERLSDRLEDLEEEMLTQPTQATLQQVHSVRRELLLLRRAAWPMRELVAELQREKHECVSDTTRTYFRDVYDHCVQIIDLIETYRETAAALTEIYMSAVSNRMNEIMKVLTIIGTIFIPLTFLAGVYGMNMPIPENQWAGTYPLFWLLCAGIAGGMLLWFRRRGWL